MVFDVYCPSHNSRILLTRRNMISFWNGPDGPHLRWRCECGHEGILGRDGSTPDAPPVVDEPAA